MSLRQHSVGKGLLYLAALVAALSPSFYQAIFAVIGIGIIGMAHGASDLAVVESRKRTAFLSCYLVMMLCCLLFWQLSPAIALPSFLIASAIHFVLEEPPTKSWTIRLSLGIGLITLPTLFHAESTLQLLEYAGFSAQELPAFMVFMRLLGGITAFILIVATCRTRHYSSLRAVLALLFFPPLVGFTLGFLVLHAFPQTESRRDALGCKNYTHYLSMTWPILGLAVLFSLFLIIVCLPDTQNSVRSAFTVLTALAIPHLLITPYFERRKR
ncbi:Brp/Blh family beta-carotene 15,15'-dioxygenase [Rosenbergiella collisarenosi]|uniref:Brp/Blh family beta-carotene 15,15'-dioxygenase n=1 Tax=Rosenbergiella collisarenosi TaxID=1544695 RepID=UPI001F4E59D9|nr:Brp/Blh family beta-carotene 15,15'-dioxygenase [Rosenbergiella collisarenosi]